MDVAPGEAGNLCSLIQLYKKDYHRTTQAIQDGKYFTDLSKESDSLEHQVRKDVRHKHRTSVGVHFLHES